MNLVFLMTIFNRSFGSLRPETARSSVSDLLDGSEPEERNIKSNSLNSSKNKYVGRIIKKRI